MPLCMRQTMKKLARVIIALSILGVVVSTDAQSASPCDGVDRSLTSKGKAVLSPRIARQLHSQSVDILQSFRVDGWTILYVDSHEADEAFLFYSRNPAASNFITLWSGAARKDERSHIKDWTLKNAPGIPLKLAECFAWHVTNDRDL